MFRKRGWRWGLGETANDAIKDKIDLLVFPNAAINFCCKHQTLLGICTKNVFPLLGFCSLIFARGGRGGRTWLGRPKGQALVYIQMIRKS